MPLTLKLAASGGKEIVLLKTESSDRQAEQTSLGKVILDFELSPLSLTSAEDRQRALAALVQLKSESAAGENLVSVQIPPSWGVAQRLPNPSLPEGQLREHLQWELSMALLDAMDQYQYNFAFDDDSVLLVALRCQLFELLKQLVEDAGFECQGLSFEGDPWQLVDLACTTARLIKLPKPEPQPQESPVQREEVKRLAFRRPSGQPPGRFFTILILIAVVALAVFVYWKLTTKKPAAPPMTHREPSEVAPVQPDTIAPPAEQPAGIAGEGAWTAMPQRMALMQQILNLTSGKCDENLIAFTADRFIGQISSPNFDDVNDCITRIKNLPDLADVKSRLALPENGRTRGVVCGSIGAALLATTPGLVDSTAIVTLAKKWGLRHRNMIFSGGKSEVTGFLSDVSAGGYAIYRVIVVPWGDDRYRVSLEF